MAYFKTNTKGELPSILGTTGEGTAPSMPNSGVSVITATSAEVYVLQPPVTGCQKTLVFNTYSTTALPVVKFCTAAAQSISLLGVSTNLTVIKSAATKSTVAATVVQLIGINSTRWAITNVFPANVSTGTTVIALGVTVSST